MTSVDTPTSTAPRRRGLGRLAAGLASTCLVLSLLAIEQRQAIQAWSTISTEWAPATSRAWDWAIEGGPRGLSGLRDAVGRGNVATATGATGQQLAGEFNPADPATRDQVGAVTFVAAHIRLETGEVFRTQPLRIAAGREAFVAGQTYAERLSASPAAQIELRRIVPELRGATVAATRLCGGEAPGVVALLHRRDRVEMMLFQARTIVGPDAAPASLCAVWHFRAR